MSYKENQLFTQSAVPLFAFFPEHSPVPCEEMAGFF